MGESTGGCLCGAVRYTFDEEPSFVGHCFCRDCQMATGSGGTTVLAVSTEGFSLQQGQVTAYQVTSDSGRVVSREFCPTCGTPLFTRAQMNPDAVFIKCATLDQPETFKPDINCWTSSAQPWTPIPDVETSFEANPPG